MLKAVNFPLPAAVLAKTVRFYKFYSITFNSFAQTNTHTRSQIWFIEINVDSALRPRWSSHNGRAGRPLMGVSD